MVISITIPDNIAVRVRDGFCEWHGFQPNGETKQDFVQRKIREFIKEAVRRNESANAADVAYTSSESEIILS